MNIIKFINPFKKKDNVDKKGGKQQYSTKYTLSRQPSKSVQCSKIETEDMANGEISHNLLKDPILNRYKIMDIIYDKHTKGAYIVSHNNTLVFLKINKNHLKQDTLLLLKGITHTNIINVIDYGLTDDYSYNVTEYFDSINLSTFIHNNPEPSESILLQIIKQIATGLHYLHTNSIIHCDIKPDNILINGDLQVKITDYDLTHICNEDGEYQSDHIFGTKHFIAPESHSLCLYSKKSDIWAFGVMLYKIINGKYPHGEFIDFDSRSSLNRRNVFKHMDSSSCSFRYLRVDYLVTNMLKFRDSDRMGCSDVLEYIG